MERRSNKQRSRASMQSVIRGSKMIWLREMRMEVSNLSTPMVRHWTSINHQSPFYRVVQSVSQLTDQLEPSMWVLERVSCLSWVQWSSSMTTFLRRKTIRRSRKLCSGGYWVLTTMLNLKVMSRKSLRLARTSTSQISLHLLIVSDPASKSQMTCRKTSLPSSVKTYTALTLILSPSLSTCTRRLGSSMSH